MGAPLKACVISQTKWTFKKIIKKRKNWLFYHIHKVFKWVQTKPKKNHQKFQRKMQKWKIPDFQKNQKNPIEETKIPTFEKKQTNWIPNCWKNPKVVAILFKESALHFKWLYLRWQMTIFLYPFTSRKLFNCYPFELDIFFWTLTKDHPSHQGQLLRRIDPKKMND